MDVNAHISTVEDQLSLLLEELTQLRVHHQSRSPSMESGWQDALEAFRIKATTIRRILDRFHHADLSTRRYLRQHLDEEFESLRKSYDSLRADFSAEDGVQEAKAK
jgi:hypothetical protein